MAAVQEEACKARTEAILASIEKLEKKVDHVGAVLLGNGAPGVFGRLDALEKADARTWATGLRIIPWIIGVAGAAYGLGVSI